MRVDPGVAPADAGPGAMAGAIAFETKDVTDLLEEGRSFGGRFITEYQSNGNVFTNSLAIFGVTGGFEYLAFGKYADGGLREDGDGIDITGSGTQLTSGLAKIAYNGANGSRLELSYENVRDDAQRPLRADFAGLRGVLATRTYTLERQNLVLSYQFGNTTDMWNPSVQIAYNSTDLYTGPMPGSTDAYSGETTSFTGKFVNEFMVSNGTVKAGADFYSDVADINGEGTAIFFAEEKATNFGLFVQAELDLTDRFRLSTGARYDFQEFEGVDGTTYDNDGPLRQHLRRLRRHRRPHAQRRRLAQLGRHRAGRKLPLRPDMDLSRLDRTGHVRKLLPRRQCPARQLGSERAALSHQYRQRPHPARPRDRPVRRLPRPRRRSRHRGL